MAMRPDKGACKDSAPFSALFRLVCANKTIIHELFIQYMYKYQSMVICTEQPAPCGKQKEEICEPIKN
jgi:hypothetical protein